MKWGPYSPGDIFHNLPVATIVEGLFEVTFNLSGIKQSFFRRSLTRIVLHFVMIWPLGSNHTEIQCNKASYSTWEIANAFLESSACISTLNRILPDSTSRVKRKTACCLRVLLLFPAVNTSFCFTVTHFKSKSRQREPSKSGLSSN